MRSGYKRTLLSIAVPIMLNSLVSQMQTLIDRIFLGRLDIVYMSAVGNATAPMWTTMAVLFALTTGATILISQAMGAGNNEKAGQYTAAMFKFNNLFAFILFFFWMIFPRAVYTAMGVSKTVIGPCITYTRYYAPVFIISGLGASCGALLQTCGYTSPLVIYGVIRSSLNIFLDWLLIFGHWGLPAMGIAGAALATTIAEFTGGIVLAVIIIRSRKLETKPSLAALIKAPFTPYVAAMKMGLPAAAEEFAWNAGNLLLIRLLNSISESAAGIFTIVFSIEVIPVAVFGALGNATLTLTGKDTGRQDYTEAKKIGKTAYFWCTGISLATLLASLLLPHQIISLFTGDTAVISSAAAYLFIVGINLFPKSGNIILGAGIRGYGDTKWMMFTQFFGTFFVVTIASWLIFVCRLGIAGVFIAVVADETLRCIINIRRFRQGPEHIIHRATEKHEAK
jgi:putative MATE family efflux protein